MKDPSSTRPLSISNQVEIAAFACHRFAERLDELLASFRDVVLADAVRTLGSWKERVWSATEETRAVSREVNEAVEIVSGAVVFVPTELVLC